MNVASVIPYLLQLAQNPMFSGLIGASLVGSAAYLLRELPAKFGKIVMGVISYETAVQNDSFAFEWLERWIAAQKYTKSWMCRDLKLNVQPSETIENNEYEKVLAPGYGYHWMFYKGWFVIMYRWQDEHNAPNMFTNKRVEGLTFRVVGPRWVMAEIIDAAEALAKVIPGRIPLYVWNMGWNKAPALRPRSKHTVFLRGTLVDDVLADVKRFAAACEDYARLGIPYRRGYLFKGKPGTGKTTLAIAIASEMKRPVYVIPLSALDDDNELSAAIMSVPRDAVLLFEEVDCIKSSAARKSKKDDDEKHPGITLGGLLNGIDGVFASEGRILIMTTNHPEVLDPALVRPGRCDYMLEFEYANSEVVARMFNNVYGEQGCNYSAWHFGEVPEVSPAMVQSVLLRNLRTPELAEKEIAQ